MNTQSQQKNEKTCNQNISNFTFSKESKMDEFKTNQLTESNEYKNVQNKIHFQNIFTNQKNAIKTLNSVSCVLNSRSYSPSYVDLNLRNFNYLPKKIGQKRAIQTNHMKLKTELMSIGDNQTFIEKSCRTYLKNRRSDFNLSQNFKKIPKSNASMNDSKMEYPYQVSLDQSDQLTDSSHQIVSYLE